MTSIVLGFAFWILVAAILPVWFAFRRHKLFFLDLALLLATPALLYVSGSLLNPAWDVGFGPLLYPFGASGAAVALLWLRVFVIDTVVPSPRRSSLFCFGVGVLAAIIAGAVLPPLYE